MARENHDGNVQSEGTGGPLSSFSAPSCFNSSLSKVGSYLPFISVDNKSQFKVHTIPKAGIPSLKRPPYPPSLSSWERGRDLTRHGPTVLESRPRHWPRCPDSWFWGRWAGVLQPSGPEGRRHRVRLSQEEQTPHVPATSTALRGPAGLAAIPHLLSTSSRTADSRPGRDHRSKTLFWNPRQPPTWPSCFCSCSSQSILQMAAEHASRCPFRSHVSYPSSARWEVVMP